MHSNTHIKFVIPSVLMLGFTTLATQIIALREFLTLFNGNELVIGIILANWMLLTGLGAYLGRFVIDKTNRARLILSLLGLLAFIPVITVWFLHTVWYLLFPPGMMAGIIHVFYYSILVLAPFCVVSGVLFTLLAREESIQKFKNKIGDVYAWESLGSLVGGVILNFILIWLFTTFQILIITMILVAVVTLIIAVRLKFHGLSALLALVNVIFIVVFFQSDLDKKVRQLAFSGQEIKYISDSPFGLFVITQQQDQVNYYENNILIASSGDLIEKEESVHLTMIQHENPQKVLVLSGIISGIEEEITKYSTQSIDYVDINPEIIKIAKQRTDTLATRIVRLIKKDPIRYLKKSRNKYDVVLINIPKPSTIELNRYYTSEFFQLLKRNLNKNAVISLSIPSSGNYMNDEMRKFLSIIYKTVQSEFKQVIILPAHEDYLIASDTTLHYNVAHRIEAHNIPTRYVNTYYIDDQLLEFRSKNLQKQLDPAVAVNTDFSPVFYQSQIKLWLSHFNINYWIPGILIMLFSGFFFFKASAVYKGVYAAGFVGTTIEIVLLLVFQVVFGYIYAVAGIFIMVFMGGLALGSYQVTRSFPDINKLLFRRLQLAITVFAFLLPVVFFLFKTFQMPDSIVFAIFVVLIATLAAMVGAVFSVASRISGNDYSMIASSAYGLDLLGAATGALLFSVYLIPVLGFGWSVFVIGLFNLIVVTIIHVK